MRAVGYLKSLPIEDPASLQDVDIPAPVPGKRDLVVRVEAISVNPVDAKMRKRAQPTGTAPAILGWDAVGTVHQIGPDVTLFKPGDKVWYAGSIARPGANSELHAVDERIVSLRPTSLSIEQAAALPLTAITAYEMLFDRLGLVPGHMAVGGNILIVGGAGGVGSIAIQLVRALTGRTVIATASRPETQAWVRELGAHVVIDHAKPLSQELRRAGIASADLIFSTNQSDRHWPEIVETLTPQGRVGLIDDPEPIDVRMLKRKSGALVWELMFTRAIFETPDMIAQHKLLAEVARLVDAGKLRTTLSEVLGPINAANLRRAHALIESNTTKGKLVLAGW
ncbi:MAG: zinc-binding alcohol dehydrogenase family protein [Hyphomicrobiales bacterium]|nr:MAG: zinc-binding alcohol dehydrogenase family protein [Hyphomicrobiales bacterium]